MGAILMGIDPVFYRALAVGKEDCNMPVLVCGDRICSAVFHDTADGWQMALEHAKLAHKWRWRENEE